MSEPNSNLIKADGEEIFNASMKALAEALTGIFSSDKKDWALSTGYLLQRVRSGKFLQSLSTEWAKYRKKGKIKNDYLTTEQGQACLQELLDSLDRESPDEVRFAAMKAVLLTAATETVTNRDSVLPQQFMRVCRGLSSGQLLVLTGSLKLFEKAGLNGERVNSTGDCGRWAQNVASEMNLKYADLVRSHEEALVLKRLISETIAHNKNLFAVTEYYRLTEFGYNLCRFIQQADAEKNS